MKSPVELNSLSENCFISPGLMRGETGGLQTRPIFQILSFLRNNSLAVAKLQTDMVLNTPLNHETSQLTFTCSK